MTRSSKTPTVFIIVSLILVFEASNNVRCQPFYEEVNDIMSMSLEDDRAAVRNPTDNCIKPDDFCVRGSRGCCSGSDCRCNLWGYNCRCQFNDDVSMSFESDKGSMYNPSDKHFAKINPEKRSCIRRGGACDHRPNDCCYSSSCRCNLWGSNCRCQRVGLFQKWG